MNKLSIQKRAQIIGLLVEGNSMRATSRLADCSINTVTKLLIDIGAACQFYQAQVIKNVSSKRVQCDEIWSFCYSKEKNVAPEHKGVLGHGDAYTWTAIDAEPNSRFRGLWVVVTTSMQKHLSTIWQLAWPVAFNSPQTATALTLALSKRYSAALSITRCW